MLKMIGRRTTPNLFMGLLLVLLFSPFLVLAIHLPFQLRELSLPARGEVENIFFITALQAMASAVASLILGLLGGFGLMWALSRCTRKWIFVIEGLILLPNAAPVLLLLLAMMKLFPWAHGIVGVIVIQSLLNCGLVAVAFANLVRSKVARQAELAWVEGASGLRFFFQGVLPAVRSELLLLWLFVFAICFASFAIPLAIGGSHATTVEVLIYQKIRISGDWGQALGLAFLQMLAIMLLSFFLKNERGTSATFRPVATPLLSWAPGLFFALFPAAILVVGLLSGLLRGYEELMRMPMLIEDLPRLIAGSVLVGFGSGFVIVILLLVMAYQPPQGWFAKVWTGYAAPSSVLVGFSLLILWRSFGFATYLKIILGLGLIAIPSFYRYEWRAVLDSLQGQALIAQTLGAGPWLIFSKVIYPQVIARACFIGGMAALWAWGDFALSSVLGERTMTLAMAAQQMMGAYRFDGATFLVWILMLGGLATFAIFTGAGYVLGSKPQA